MRSTHKFFVRSYTAVEFINVWMKSIAGGFFESKNKRDVADKFRE